MLSSILNKCKDNYFPYFADRFGTHRDSMKKTVDGIRDELTEVLPKYKKIRDCLMGEDHIKSMGELYLPNPYDDEDDANLIAKKYQRYINRATFLNATGLTQRTIVGKLFAKPATIELPIAMEGMLDNVNGEGLAFNQLIEKCIAETFAFGRCGLYADFSNLSNQTLSIADTKTLSPVIVFCQAEDIINWRIDKKRKKLTRVVVREPYEVYDGFKVSKEHQYRVMSLDETDTVIVQIYQKLELQSEYVVVDEFIPLLPGGKPWNEIPYALMGSINNDWEIDESPLAQITTYDLALYRNSADVEEAAFYVGQPTPYVSGVNEQWMDDMGMQNLRFGSGRFIPLQDPQSKVGLVQASEKTMYTDLIAKKMEILKHLGATIFSAENLAQDQTATGAIYQALQVHAPLITTSRNVVEAVNKITRFAGMFLGIDYDTEEIEIKLNTDVLDNPLGVTGLQTALQLWKDGALTWAEMREQLRVQGLTQFSPEEALELIETEGLGNVEEPALPALEEELDEMNQDGFPSSN